MRPFPAAWKHPDADITLKKRLLRTAVNEIVVTHRRLAQRPDHRFRPYLGATDVQQRNPALVPVWNG